MIAGTVAPLAWAATAVRDGDALGRFAGDVSGRFAVSTASAWSVCLSLLTYGDRHVLGPGIPGDGFGLGGLC